MFQQAISFIFFTFGTKYNIIARRNPNNLYSNRKYGDCVKGVRGAGESKYR